MMGLRASVTSTDANPTPHLLTYPGREGRRSARALGHSARVPPVNRVFSAM